MLITSLTNQKVKDWVKLSQKKNRYEAGLFMVEGIHLVLQALNTDLVEYLIIKENAEFKSDFHSVYYVTDEVMKKICQTTSIVDVVAVCRMRPQEINYTRKTILLDNVADPGNVGTIIRTALSFGFKQIIFSKDCADIYNDKILRSTQGAIFEIDYAYLDLKEVILKLQENGIVVYGTALKNAKALSDIEKTENVGLLFGNEGSGVSSELLELTEKNIKIEMETFESLNVAIAAGICMYYFRGQ